MNRIGYIKMNKNSVMKLYDDVKINKKSLSVKPNEDLIDSLTRTIECSDNDFILVETRDEEVYLNKNRILMIVKDANATFSFE